MYARSSYVHYRLPTTLAAQSSRSVADVVETMEWMGCSVGVVNAVAEAFAVRDSVTMSELRLAVSIDAFPGRDLVRLRRIMDAKVRW